MITCPKRCTLNLITRFYRIEHENRSVWASQDSHPEEIQLLFTQGLTKERDRALFGICLYTACRIREACSLRTADVSVFTESNRTWG